jgi:hypothetical protein
VSESANSANLELSGERQVAFSDRGRSACVHVSADRGGGLGALLCRRHGGIGARGSAEHALRESPGARALRWWSNACCGCVDTGRASTRDAAATREISDPKLLANLPAGHKAKAAELLQRVTLNQESDREFMLDSETEEVALDARGE